MLWLNYFTLKLSEKVLQVLSGTDPGTHFRPRLSSWIQTDLFGKCSQMCSCKKYGIQENPVSIRKQCLRLTRTPGRGFSSSFISNAYTTLSQIL